MCSPAPALLCSNTKLSSGTKYRSGSAFSCAGSDIQLVRKLQRLHSSASHKYSCDNDCIMCLLHCRALWLWGMMLPSLRTGWHYRPSVNTSLTFFLCSQKVLSPFNFPIFLTVPYSLCRKGWTGRNRQWNTMQEDAKSVKTPTLSTHNQCQL